ARRKAFPAGRASLPRGGRRRASRQRVAEGQSRLLGAILSEGLRSALERPGVALLRFRPCPCRLLVPLSGRPAAWAPARLPVAPGPTWRPAATGPPPFRGR